MNENLLENHSVVMALGQAIQRGEAALSNVPGLLRRVITEQSWRKRLIRETGEVCEFDAFMDFLTAEPLEGLGTNVDELRLLVAHDVEISALFEKALKDVLPPLNVNGTNQHSNSGVGITNPSDKTNDAEYVIRRLKRDNPALAQQVIDGTLTANQAAIQAGFRKRKIQIPLDDAESAARLLARHYSVDELIDALNRIGGDA